ncbi:MAG: phage tail-type lysozyme domain-containing protein [Proteobacteria bacterium]|nr:phage tail-type lysozyme domain-containing protein [Pseudomonadota bacterium]
MASSLTSKTGLVPLAGQAIAQPLNDAGDARAATNLFTQIADGLGAIADKQAAVEGAREGAIAGLVDGYKPTNSATIRGHAFDRAGNRAFQTQTEANFRSDALDLHQKHSDDPVAFKSAYDALTAQYQARVAAAGPELVGDFKAGATTLGTTLRLKVNDAFEARQKDQARARLFETVSAHETSVARLAMTDPESENTLATARASLGKVEADIDAAVADGHVTAEQAIKQKQALRSSTLLSLYTARAQKMTDPDEIDRLHQGIRKDIAAGKLALLSPDGIQQLDTGLSQLAKARRNEITAATSTYQKALDDYIDRNGKGLTPPAAELAALEKQGASLGAQGRTMLAQAQAKLQVEQTMRRMNASERAAYVSKLEGEAKGAGSDRGAQIAQAFVARGLSPVAAAALAGQSMAESAGRTDAVNPGDGRDGSDSIGLFQWNGERAARLKAFAAKRGTTPRDFDTQIDFVMLELETSEKGRGDALRNAGDLRGANRAVISYLRPAGWTEGNPEAGHNWSGRLANAERIAASGVSKPMAQVIDFARSRRDSMNSLDTTDPLRAAEQAGVLPGGQVAPVDFGQPPDVLGQQMRARATQAEAVARGKGMAPVYFRPEERRMIGEVLAGGGAKALHVMNGIVRGAGGNATKALAEIGDTAPELAHASMLAVTTGDDTAQRRVAEALEARKVKGASVLRASGTELDSAFRDVVGTARMSYSAEQQGRIKATAALLFEHEVARRGVDPKGADAPELLASAMRAAAGETRGGGRQYGGIIPKFKTNGWSSGQVVAPPNVEASRFGEVLRAMEDGDLAGMADPPVTAAGKPMTVKELLRALPHAGDGGYRFGNIDASTGTVKDPVRAKSGAIFFLDWSQVSPKLRERIPEAFR